MPLSDYSVHLVPLVCQVYSAGPLEGLPVPDPGTLAAFKYGPYKQVITIWCVSAVAEVDTVP